MKEKGYAVLDKGYVAYVRHMGDDLSPVEDARMSTSNPTGIDPVKDDRLREYLWKGNPQHSSPFEGCVLTIEFKIPLFVLHQLDRHRTLDLGAVVDTYDEFRKFTSRNEFSGRYAEFKDEFYIPDIGRIKGQNNINKQGSEGDIPFYNKTKFIGNLTQYSKDAFALYEQALLDGVSKEVARLLIPNNVYTKIRVTSNLLNWFKFLRLRLDHHAQYEVRVYAEAVEMIIKELWPKCWELFDKYSKVK